MTPLRLFSVNSELDARTVPAAGLDADGAVTALYETHALDLVRLALVMVGERQTAEDVVHEAFIGLYRGWSRLRDPSKALTYLRSSVLNACRSTLRRRRFTLKPDRLLTVPSAEHEVIEQEDQREVLEALRRLPHRQRETLVLRYVFDLSEAEIAETMKVTRGTVKSNAAKGRAKLEALLGGEDV